MGAECRDLTFVYAKKRGPLYPYLGIVRTGYRCLQPLDLGSNINDNNDQGVIT